MNLLFDQKLQVSQKTSIFQTSSEKGSSLQKEKVEKFGELRLLLMMMMKTLSESSIVGPYDVIRAHVLCPLERT